MSLREWRTLATIAYMENASTTSLARAGFLDKAQISRIVAKLVGEGLIQRIGAESRGGVLQLTEKGKRQHKEGLLFAKHHNDRLLTPLSGDEVAQLWSLLDRLMVEAQRRYREAKDEVSELTEPTASSPKGWSGPRKRGDASRATRGKTSHSGKQGRKAVVREARS